MTVHPIRSGEIETLRADIEALCIALEPSALDGDFEAEAETLELLRRIEDR